MKQPFPEKARAVCDSWAMQNFVPQEFERQLLRDDAFFVRVRERLAEKPRPE